MATRPSPLFSRGVASDLTTPMTLLGNLTTLSLVVAENVTSPPLDDFVNGNNISSTTTLANFTTPPPAELPHYVWLTVVLGLLAGVVMIVTVLGNITVLLAFGLERTIRQPTNYFLASLAVSDLLIGTFSMPLYTQYLLIGVWPLGPWLCDLWLSLDWTVCLTSQYTVFLITMDRFLSVKIPAKYRNWRTERKVLIMITITWVLPTVVFFTSIIGWQYFVGKSTVKEGQCEVLFMNDAMFTFLLTIGYFWITLFVIGILYGGIYKVALDLQKKSDAKHKKLQSTMELAGDGPNYQDRSGALGGAEGSNNNSSGGDSNAPNQHKSHGKSGGKANKRKSVRAALPCPVGAPAVNTTSFSTNKAEKDDDRSSSPAFASDDENSSSGGAVGAPKSPLSSGVYIGRPNPSAGIVNSALFANTGGLVRSLHGDLFFGQVDKQEIQNLIPPPSYSQAVGMAAGSDGSDTEGNVRGTRRNDADDSVYSSASEKQTTPLLQDEINKGSRYIDEKSFMSNLNSESAALLPDISKDASGVGDCNVNDGHIASSPVWKRRYSLPPADADDAFEMDDDLSDFIAGEPATTATNVNDTPLASRHGVSNDGKDRLGQHGGAGSSENVFRNENGGGAGDDNNKHTTNVDNLNKAMNADNSINSGDATATNINNFNSLNAAGNNVASSTTGDQSSNLNNNCNTNANSAPISNNATNATPVHPSDTNEESSRSGGTHCLSAAHRRRNKDTRLHTFVKSVRSRNSRRRNRRERKSKSENRARKALRTITIILGAFVLCWTPYHIAVMCIALCKNCVNDYVYSFTYWMCYLNSPINPFCYAFANTQFKRTFLRIMRFDWHRT